ncbi:MAG: prohead protease/major capsid protein fusion protein [Geobacteraceae bacterium]
MIGRYQTRSAEPQGQKPDLNYRKLAVVTQKSDGPSTIDEDTRSVEVVGATETPVDMFDYDRWEIIPEVLLMAGCQLPESRQVPLLDTHSRYSTGSVIGSYREMQIAGSQLVGRSHFSEAKEAQGPWLKTKEGHLTDYSVGYRVLEKTYIPAGQNGIVNGRSFQGPVNVVTSWKPREMSVCPIGADEQAKARAATPSHTPPEKGKEKDMNERLRKYLESRGLPAEATEDQAWAFLEKMESRAATPPTQQTMAGTSKSEDEIRKEAERAENARVTEIIAMCEQLAVPAEERAVMLEPEVTVDQVRKQILDRMVKNSPDTGYRKPIDVVADERDKFRAAAEDSLILRASNIILEKPAPGALDLRGYSLRELARESLRMAGISFVGNPMEMVGRALTTSDFPYILAVVANKELMEGYESAGETWEEWCGVGSVSDFKTHTMVRVSEMDDLDEILEGQEYKQGKRTEGKEEYKVATYGKLFDISRQTIINDDLSALTDTPRGHGEAAARKVGDLPYAVLTANAAMGDGVALFHGTHGNLGTTGAVSVTTIGEGFKLMGLQKDIGGKRRLNISPEYFIGPKSIETICETFFQTLVVGTQASPNVKNIYGGERLKRVYESRLDDASATAWYLMGRKGKTVKVFFLNGNRAPYLEMKEGWSVDGVQYKVRIDAGAKAVDWKSSMKNAGA